MVGSDSGRLLRVAEDAARGAGRRLASIFDHGKLSVKRKYDYVGSIVTNGDIAAERVILERIRRSGIKSTVVSEEKGRVDYGSEEIVWAVDPLDGTLNFAKHIPYFAVSIGVVRRERTVAGVVYNPLLDEMFTAERGHGAYMNGRRVSVSRTTALRNASLIFEWWDPEPSIPDPLALEKRIYRFTSNVRSPGSIALNLCSVACGRFDGLITVFPRSPIHEPLAGAILIEEAGGRVTNSLGESWENLSRSIIGAGPGLQPKLLKFIRSSR